MIEINGVQYEILMYVEKKELKLDDNVRRLTNSFFAAMIAGALLDHLFKFDDMYKRKK
jgi:hypothetical protein